MAKLTVPIIVKWDDIEEDLAKGNIVKVIRCKDCKYFTRDSITGVTIPGTEYCIFTMNNRIEENDYCSRAEMKEK